MVGAEHALADRAHVTGLRERLLPAAEPPEVDAEAVPGAQGLGVGGPVDAGAVVDQSAVQLQRLGAAAEPAEADADLVAGGEGVGVVGAERLRARASATSRYVCSASGQRPRLPERVGDFVPRDQGVGVVRAEHPGAGRGDLAAPSGTSPPGARAC